ncbi:hypothetical protein ACFPTX_04275 [Pseudomonas sp. GCM10022188]|uniref:hypothetical protein n=1 Tax=Pseudomonas TaxID=286 RepID=UPI001E39B456|nr:hypothetical protein [Pseudomonas oryzagri]MCC6076898.1 hypothetical protein [Pseudomonas oryzagri]
MTLLRASGLSFDSLIASILTISIVQAFFVNILNIDAYLTPIFLLFLASHAILSKAKIRRDAALPLAIASWILLYTVLIFFTNTRSLLQEFIYQLFSAITFFVFIIYFSTLGSASSEPQNFKKTKYVLVLYLSASLIIHFTMWDQIASIFYKRENDFGGLLMDGKIHRMYGLLFNPLASAFSALILSIILYLLDCRDKTIYFVLLVIIALALSRSTLLLALIWLTYVLMLKYKKLYLLLALPLISLIASYLSSDINLWLTTHIIADDSGSIAEHIRNYQIGLNHAFAIYGEGFRDARELGAWNIRLESMPLQYALTGGIGLFIPISFLLIICTKRLFNRYGILKAASCLPLLPIIVSFPLHTFNLPIIFLSILMSLWAVKHETPKSAEKWKKAF